ncbi:Glutamine--tRNA ligase [Trichinella pseudospiralis]
MTVTGLKVTIVNWNMIAKSSMTSAQLHGANADVKDCPMCRQPWIKSADVTETPPPATPESLGAFKLRYAHDMTKKLRLLWNKFNSIT